jgi:arsenate reductase
VHAVAQGKLYSTKNGKLLMDNQAWNILFLCTGNSARSVMAEALVTILGNGRFKGYSAGSKPTGRLHPFALEQIKALDADYPTDDMRSKSWDEFAVPDAPRMDFIVTVCDNAAGEQCPLWPGHPVSAHWGFEDPAAVEGTDEEKRAAFGKVCAQIMRRIQTFVSLPVQSLNTDTIRREMKKIGESQA